MSTPCETCGLTPEGNLHLNEFSSLSPEDRHFLKVFVQSEGKVREMEAALGLSYPTIRTRITDLKNKIFIPRAAPKKETVKDILEKLERNEIPFEEAMKPEIEKILAMHKTGTLSSEQASQLLEELSEAPVQELKSTVREKSFGEKFLTK